MLTSRGDVVATGSVLSHSGLYRVFNVDIRYTRVLKREETKINGKNWHKIQYTHQIWINHNSSKRRIHAVLMWYTSSIHSDRYTCRCLQAVQYTYMCSRNRKYYSTYKIYMCTDRNPCTYSNIPYWYMYKRAQTTLILFFYHYMIMFTNGLTIGQRHQCVCVCECVCTYRLTWSWYVHTCNSLTWIGIKKLGHFHKRQ